MEFIVLYTHEECQTIVSDSPCFQVVEWVGRSHRRNYMRQNSRWYHEIARDGLTGEAPFSEAPDTCYPRYPFTYFGPHGSDVFDLGIIRESRIRQLGVSWPRLAKQYHRNLMSGWNSAHAVRRYMTEGELADELLIHS